MRVLIVDDEPLARQEVRALLDETATDVDVVGECDNAVEAITAVNRLHPDVVFLDIQMPRISGLEMVAMLDPDTMPRIVFLTAYDEYAVEAFEKSACDYLLKPTDRARMAKTLERLRAGNRVLPFSLTHAPLRQVPCLGHNRIALVKAEDIEYVCMRAAGVTVVDAQGVERGTELTLRTLEERGGLFRCHRQYLVNLGRIGEIRLSAGGGADILTTGNRMVPVSRRFLRPLKDRLEIP